MQDSQTDVPAAQVAQPFGGDPRCDRRWCLDSGHGAPRNSSNVNGARYAVDGDIRELSVELLTRQLRFRRHMQDSLGVDSAGLTTMIHLAGVGTNTPTAIARTLETSTAATSLVLNRLEASGHICRQPHPTDRRKVVVVPVPASITSAYEYANPVINGTDQLAATLTLLNDRQNHRHERHDNQSTYRERHRSQHPNHLDLRVRAAPRTV